MNVEALPFTLLILLAEFAIGSLWAVWLLDLRGRAAPSFTNFGAVVVLIFAGFAFLAAATVEVSGDVDGYPLDRSLLTETRLALLVTFILSFLYALGTFTMRRAARFALGGGASFAGLASLLLLAGIFALPAWGFAGVALSLLLGALVVGGVSMGMVLGHWYLVTPRLSEKPLLELVLLLMAALVAQALLLAPALALSHDTLPNGIDRSLLQDPFFLMRLTAGLAFPFLLTYLTYSAASVRAMQSATGLLYIDMALIISAEIVGKGLLFVTAVPM